ncbi:MAG: glycosyltransferase family 2 protein, partial [Bacteroidota bacterium]
MLDLSLVIPVYNEAESLPELAAGIEAVCAEAGLTYEVWLVDDGSSDSSWEVIEALHAQDPRFMGVRFRRNYGKSAALAVGFEQARGRYVITMDADLQDDPAEIPLLIGHLEEGEYDLVSGWKQKRHDPLGKTIPSRFFNAITRGFSGIPLHDFNCGLKIYRREVVKSVRVYGELHRYIPLLAKWEGYERIGEKVVQHHARKYGHTKFG